MDRRSFYDAAGGARAFETLTARFYDKVKDDPLLAPVFASFTADHARNVAIWLGEVFGGPKQYSNEHGGHRTVLEKHAGLKISEAQKERWLQLMLETGREVLPADEALQQRFAEYLRWGAAIAVDVSQSGFQPGDVGPMPAWDWPTSQESR